MYVVNSAMHYDANIYVPLVHYRKTGTHIQQQNLEFSDINGFIYSFYITLRSLEVNKYRGIYENHTDLYLNI